MQKKRINIDCSKTEKFWKTFRLFRKKFGNFKKKTIENVIEI